MSYVHQLSYLGDFTLYVIKLTVTKCLMCISFLISQVLLMFDVPMPWASGCSGLAYWNNGTTSLGAWRKAVSQNGVAMACDG